MSLLERSIYECGLGASLHNSLVSQLHINNIGDLIKFSEMDLIKCRNVGHVGIKKIRLFLESHGMKLKESEKVIKKKRRIGNE